MLILLVTVLSPLTGLVVAGGGKLWPKEIPLLHKQQQQSGGVDNYPGGHCSGCV
mgnify:CR=1 FL=1